MDDENKKASGKGIAEGASDAIQKIIKVKKMAAIIGTLSPVVGVVLLIILAAVLVFLPIISTYSFSGGIFSSSTNNSSDLFMTMNLEGFAKSDIKILQDFYDGKIQYSELDFKKNSDEEIDLALLVATIQNQGLVNFEDGNVFDLNEEISKSEEQISNFKTIDDFNSYVEKYGTPNNGSTNSNNQNYNGESIVDNEQNKDFYRSLSDKGGQVYYIYPGTRKLLGYMISNDITYSSVIYKEWPCGEDICNNSSEIWSDWEILRDITSNNGTDATCTNTGGAWKSICNINFAISYAKDYLLKNDPSTWEYKNIKYDLKHFQIEVLNTESSDSTADEIIRNLSGDAIIPDGNFEIGKSYATVSVNKYLDYNSYEDYATNVFIKHIYMDCDNCTMKDATDESKIKQAYVIYDNMYSIKELFDYFNDGTTILSNTGGGSSDIPGINYSCSNGQPHLATYPGHSGIDINGVPEGTYVYPLFEGTVTKINIYDSNCYPRGNDVTGYTCGHCTSGYGNMVVIKGTAEDGNEYYSMYAHLNEILVNEGQNITLDTVIGKMGNTGCSTGPHLHLELRKDYDSKSTIVYADSIYSNNAISSLLCSRTEG